MSRYELELTKEGWVTRKENSSYKYVRVPNSPIHSTLEEAETWARENEGFDTHKPWIDHKINGSRGHLMTLEVWKEDCDARCFIDYDGYGDMLDEKFEIVKNPSMSDDSFFDYSISPSDYTEKRFEIPSNVKYIHWFNR